MWKKRKREITDKIVEFVALDMRRVNIVEGKGFKELMRTLEPGSVWLEVLRKMNLITDYSFAKVI